MRKKPEMPVYLLLVSLSAALLTFFVVLASADAQPAPTPIPESARQSIVSGSYKSAIPALISYLKDADNSAEGHFLLGRSYFETKKYSDAKIELKKAMRLSAGGQFTVEANEILLKMPKEVVAPKQKYSVAKIKGRRVAAAGFARPRIISFYAAWAAPCQQLSTDLDKVKGQYGEQLEIVRVDVDDPKNEKMMEQYDVSPIPTVVFLDPEGKVTNYFVGYANADELNSSVKKALNKG